MLQPAALHQPSPVTAVDCLQRHTSARLQHSCLRVHNSYPASCSTSPRYAKWFVMLPPAALAGHSSSVAATDSATRCFGCTSAAHAVPQLCQQQQPTQTPRLLSQSGAIPVELRRLSMKRLGQKPRLAVRERNACCPCCRIVAAVILQAKAGLTISQRCNVEVGSLSFGINICCWDHAGAD